MDLEVLILTLNPKPIMTPGEPLRGGRCDLRMEMDTCADGHVCLNGAR
jgi:hypothetical protein